MNILITGGDGYIAKALYSSIGQRYQVTAINRSHVNLENSQRLAEWFDNKHFDVVIHAASKVGGRLVADDISVLDTNLQIYYNLLDNKHHYDKFINIGSGAELYATSSYYGLSKHVIRTSILQKENFYNIRVYGIFDENELDTRFIKANILKYIKGADIEILQDKMMDFFYMKDFTKLVQYYIDVSNPLKEFDCCYSESCYLSQIANKINNLSEHKVGINIMNGGITDNYTGINTPIGLNFIGLDIGIKLVYEKLYANNVR
jgi:dTDP-4-dehydrorhamnose reductase